MGARDSQRFSTPESAGYGSKSAFRDLAEEGNSLATVFHTEPLGDCGDVRPYAARLELQPLCASDR
jgi:hypothetical protein